MKKKIVLVMLLICMAASVGACSMPGSDGGDSHVSSGSDKDDDDDDDDSDKKDKKKKDKDKDKKETDKDKDKDKKETDKDKDKDKKEKDKDKDKDKDKKDKDKDKKDNKNDDGGSDDSDEAHKPSGYDYESENWGVDFDTFTDDEFYEVYGMTKEEYKAEIEAIIADNRESDELYQAFLDARDKTETEFDVALKGIRLVYDSDIPVHTILGPDTLVLNTDDEGFLYLTVYNEGDIEDKTYKDIVSKCEEKTDSAGNKRLEVKASASGVNYYVYEKEHKLIIVSFNMVELLNDLDISLE